jgi:hypothetical protein
MSRLVAQHNIEPYVRTTRAQFAPKAPPVPEGMKARWSLSNVVPLEPGWVLCTWHLDEDMTVYEELRNAHETLVVVHDMLRRVHPKESDHPGCAMVDGVIARTLVKLGTVRRFNLPQHLEKYVEDMEIEL